MTAKGKAEISFALYKINLEQFAIIEKSYKEENDKFGLTTALNFSINVDSKQVKVAVKCELVQEENPFLIIVGSCEFKIVPESWESFVNVEKNTIVFPKGFMAHMATLTVGSVRGMLHIKTENTPFNKFVLPTINVASMITEDVKFNV